MKQINRSTIVLLLCAFVMIMTYLLYKYEQQGGRPNWAAFGPIMILAVVYALARVRMVKK